MDETITILAGILAGMVIIDYCIRIHLQAKQGQVPVMDTMDVLLFVVSLAVLLTIAAKVRGAHPF